MKLPEVRIVLASLTPSNKWFNVTTGGQDANLNPSSLEMSSKNSGQGFRVEMWNSGNSSGAEAPKFRSDFSPD